MVVYGLRVTESSIAVVGNAKVVAWNLPVGDGVLDTRVSIDAEDSVRTTILDHSALVEPHIASASVSPDFNHIAIVRQPTRTTDPHLDVYDMPTGKHLAGTTLAGHRPWFTPDGREVWCDKGEGWTIVGGSGSDLPKLEELEPARYQPDGCPWESAHGHEVTDDGWILSSRGKRLLWLPPHWRSSKTHKVWSGQFLALLRPELPEAVILELLVG